MCPSKYCFKRHKSMDQKVFKGCNLAWLQKKGHFWDNWIQRAKYKGTFILFTFNRYIYNHSLTSKTQTLVLNMIHCDLDNLFFFLFLFFCFSCTHSFFFFLFLCTKQCCSDHTIKILPIYLTIDLHLPFLPNLNRNIPYLNVPFLYGKGTSYQWRFRV